MASRHCARLSTLLTVIVLLAFAAAVPASAEVVPAAIVIAVGDSLGPSTVSTLNSPFTDSQGRVGFVGSLADAQRFIWWGDGPVFFSNDAHPDTLTGGEGTMGVSDTGGFIYSPSFHGFDAVYTHAGKLLAEEDSLPPLPGLYSTFNSRPTMLPDGTAYWIGGSSATQGGSSTNRHLFMVRDVSDPSGIVRVLGGGDVIEGKAIKTSASNFTYWISDNSEHHIHILDMNVTLNEHVYLDGAFVAQEGDSTGQGDTWSGFDIVSVNNSGDYIFTGDTNGPIATDVCVVVNGTIRVREGDTLDGVLLASGWDLRTASIDNEGYVLHVWGSSSNEHLFYGLGSDLENSIHVLGVGDTLDVDADGTGDYLVEDFEASATIGPGSDLAVGGMCYLEVSLEPLPAGEPVETIVYLALRPSAGAPELATRLGAELRVAPNPAPGAAEVRFALPAEGAVRLSVYDVQGRRVRTLLERTRVSSAAVRWDGRNDRGRAVPAGAYFLRLDSPAGSSTTRLVITR